MKIRNLFRNSKIFRAGLKLLVPLSLFGMLFHPLPSFAANEQTPALDFKGPADAKGLPADWKLRVHKGDAEVNLVSDSSEQVLRLKSVKSSFALHRNMVVDVREHPYLVWIWKALTLPLQGDVREKSKDDQALQLFVAFEDKRIISYIWDANAPVGTVVDESLPWPISLKIKAVVVKSGEAAIGTWLTQMRNVYEDYKRLYKKEPPRVEGIGLQINTQHTGSSAEGFIRNVVFKQQILAAH